MIPWFLWPISISIIISIINQHIRDSMISRSIISFIFSAMVTYTSQSASQTEQGEIPDVTANRLACSENGQKKPASPDSCPSLSSNLHICQHIYLGISQPSQNRASKHIVAPIVVCNRQLAGPCLRPR